LGAGDGGERDAPHCLDPRKRKTVTAHNTWPGGKGSSKKKTTYRTKKSKKKGPREGQKKKRVSLRVGTIHVGQDPKGRVGRPGKRRK